MEKLSFEYPATRPVASRAHVGAVASGDLEVLLEPSPDSRIRVVVRTSVEGQKATWKAVLDRFFARHEGAVTLEINDCGATPGVVALRLAQAVEVSES